MSDVVVNKIADLVVGEQCQMTLVVKSATARETRAKKPYLALEFFDGTDTISGNFWDWSTGNIPAVNAILDVFAKVTEWQGNKQLNITALKTNTMRHLAEFMPTSNNDIAETYRSAYALMSEVKDDTLRELALSILDEMRVLWTTVPGAKGVHHAYVGGTLVHSYSVAKIAGAIAEKIPEASYDLAVVGGMLHDLGKLYTYQINGIAIDLTTEGMMYDHIFIGAEFVGNFADSHLNTNDERVEAKISLLRHIILSHHGKLEYGSPVTPLCIEAYIVNVADQVDAAAEQIRAASTKCNNDIWTDKIFTLSNRPHISTTYVEKVMAST